MLIAPNLLSVPKNIYNVESVSEIRARQARRWVLLFLNIAQTGLSSNEFCARLIDEEGVALTPGIAFGEDWDQYVRLSFGIDDAQLDAGLIKLVKFLEKF